MTLERQSSASDCGVSCLLMIIRYYGGDISKEFLRVLTQTKKDGCDAYHLLEGARKLGFSCYGVRGDIMSLRSQDFPCIAHVKNSRQADHFVVLTNVEQTSRRVMMLDPDLGKRILSYQEYQAISQNQYLLFQVERDLPHFRKISKMEQLIFRTVIQHWNFFAHLFAFSFLYLIFHTLMMYRFTFLSMFVLESLQHLGRIVLTILCGFSERLQFFLFSFAITHFPCSFFVPDIFPVPHDAVCRPDSGRIRLRELHYNR